jgi:integrase
LEAYAKPNTQPTTYKRYEELVRIHIVPNIGRLRLNRLEPYHLQGLYSRVQETNCPRTALKVHRLLFQALKQAVRWRTLSINVATMVDAPKVEQPTPFIPAAGDIQRVFAVSESMYTGTMVYLAAMTGLRQGELLALRWRDIDLASQVRGQHSRNLRRDAAFAVYLLLTILWLDCVSIVLSRQKQS